MKSSKRGRFVSRSHSPGDLRRDRLGLCLDLLASVERRHPARRAACRRGGEERGRQRGAAAPGAEAAPDARHPPARLCRPVRPGRRAPYLATSRACRPFRSTAARISFRTPRAGFERRPRARDLCRARLGGRRCSPARAQPVRAYGLQGDAVCARSAIALLPTILLILAIGALFARRASQRFERVHDAIVRIINGDLDSRLPVTNEDDDIDKVARAVNLMLDEIARLLEQLKNARRPHRPRSAHPARRRARQDRRALDSGNGIEQLRADLGGRPRPDRKSVARRSRPSCGLRGRKRRAQDAVQGL